ncbi:MAG TPA: hypothetical protein VKK79_10605 [Candidatus Lokiarchaeia archaeon]|nr:hypothetical protein [Candidatus Lokiarchaeia archaeon]
MESDDVLTPVRAIIDDVRKRHYEIVACGLEIFTVLDLSKNCLGDE